MVDLNDYALDVDAVTEGAWARWREDGWLKLASASSPEYRKAQSEALARHNELVRPFLDPESPNEPAIERAEAEFEKVTKRLFAEHLIKDARNITAQGVPVDPHDAEQWYAILADERHGAFWDWCMIQCANADRFREAEVARMAKNFEAACSGNSDSESTDKT